MSDIINKFGITMRDGTKRELEAGAIEVGVAGELKVKDVHWTFLNTFESVREVIAPGEWAEWVRYAKK